MRKPSFDIKYRHPLARVASLLSHLLATVGLARGLEYQPSPTIELCNVLMVIVARWRVAPPEGQP